MQQYLDLGIVALVLEYARWFGSVCAWVLLSKERRCTPWLAPDNSKTYGMMLHSIKIPNPICISRFQQYTTPIVSEVVDVDRAAMSHDEAVMSHDEAVMSHGEAVMSHGEAVDVDQARRQLTTQ